MKANYTTQNGRITVEFEGDTQKSIFEQIGKFQEVFEQGQCGKCGSENLRFVTREVDGNHYYELRCMDCHARLSFGVMKVGGGLFSGSGPRKERDAWKYSFQNIKCTVLICLTTGTSGFET